MVMVLTARVPSLARRMVLPSRANVIAVKVLGSNGSGSMSDVVGGVSWAAGEAMKMDAAADAEYKATGKTSHKGSVANMSLGGESRLLWMLRSTRLSMLVFTLLLLLVSFFRFIARMVL